MRQGNRATSQCKQQFRRKLLVFLCATVSFNVVTTARAQSSTPFPTKPIHIIVPFNAGSGSDEASRVYGEMLSKLLGQPVVIENRPGGSGLVAIQAVKQAPADGHTIMLASNSPMAVNPIVMKDLPYDPFKDFRPVHGISVGSAAMVVRAESPWKSIKDMAEATRATKKPLAVGNYSQGYQLLATWLGSATGLAVTHVPYKGGAQMVTDILGGQLEIGINDLGGVTEMYKAGKIRILAVTGGKRDPKLPDVPTMIESGYPGFESYVWASMFVRAETSDDVTRKLAESFSQVLTSPEGRAYQASRPGMPLMFRCRRWLPSTAKSTSASRPWPMRREST